MVLDPEGWLFRRGEAEDAASIVALSSGGAARVQRGGLSHPFFQRQTSVVLENSGVIDPGAFMDRSVLESEPIG